jgi:phosphoserine aminotransferase
MFTEKKARLLTILSLGKFLIVFNSYIRYWSQDAAHEASKYINVNRVNPVATSAKSLQDGILDMDSWNIDKNAQYFYFCQNETIEGIEYDQKVTRRMMDRVKQENPDTIFVSDHSAILGARDLHKEGLWNDYGVVFSGVHKNFGTSGLCCAMVRDDVIDRVIENKSRAKIPVPRIFDWTEYAE